MSHKDNREEGGEAGNSKSKAKPHLLHIALSDPKSVAFILAVYLYFSGFTFAYYFYSNFGLAMTLNEVPFYNMFVFAFNVVRGYWWLTAWAFLLLVTCALYRHLEKMKAWFDPIVLLIFLGFLPALYWCSYKLAKTTAMEARTGRIPLPTVRLVIKADKMPEYQKLKVLMKASEAGKLRMLAQNKDWLFLLYQELIPGVRSLPAALVFSVAKADLVTAEMHID